MVIFHEYCCIERIKVLEDKNDALKNQLMEMVGDKERRDNQLDQLGIALDARLAQWQVMRNIYINVQGVALKEYDLETFLKIEV